MTVQYDKIVKAIVMVIFTPKKDSGNLVEVKYES